MKFNELRYQDPRTRCYLGSPSLVRLPDGALLACHDYFGPGSPQTHEGKEGLTSIYRSDDDGATWTNVNHVINAFWSNLFVHAGAVYLLGASQHYGSIVIRRSDDGGLSWTHPKDEKSGLLFAGGPVWSDPNYHCAPMPVLHHKGRLYRAFEDCAGTRWPAGFQSLVISADEDADLLQASSWRMSDKLAFDQVWAPKEWGERTNWGWLEGNVVEAPDGTLWNVLRVSAEPVADTAALVRVEDEGRRVSFDPTTGFVRMPGGTHKFTIRRDPVTGLYLTLSNNNIVPECASQRNVLSLCVSADLRHWDICETLLQDADPRERESLKRVGFQYADWQFDGDDLICLVRTAYGNAHNYHDANRITYHVVRDFRKRLGHV